MTELYEEKVKRQINIEELAIARTREKFFHYFNKLSKSNGERTKAGRDVIATLFDEMEHAIEIELANRLAGRASKCSAAIARLPIEVSALIGLQNLVAGAMGNDTQAGRALKTGKDIEDEVNAQKLLDNNSGAHAALLRRLSTTCPTEASKISLKKAFFKKWYCDEINPIDLTKKERAQSGMVLLALAEQVAERFVTRVKKKNQREKYTRVVYTFTDEFLTLMKTQTEVLALGRPEFPPLIIPPRDWTGVLSGGPYYTEALNNRAKFVRSRDWSYLREIDERERTDEYNKMDAQFKAVNKAQKTAWKINGWILETLKTCMEKGGGEKWGLPVTNKEHFPIIKDLNPMSKEFKKAQKIRTEYITKYIMLQGQVNTAMEYQSEDELYFAMAIDSRGRGYYVYGGQYLNPQGNDTARSLLLFSRGEKVRHEDDIKWIKYNCASLYGFDKADREGRIAWVNDNLDIILACASDPFASESRKFWSSADKPWQFLAACKEVEGCILNGLNHITYMPVQLDGCQNALQHTAAMMLDEALAAKVGMLPVDNVPDLYSDVADFIVRVATEQAAASYNHNKFGELDNQQLEDFSLGCMEKIRDKARNDEARWLAHMRDVDALQFSRIITANPEIISRSMCKRPVMTFIYNCSMFSRKDYICADIMEQQESDTGHPLTDAQRWRFTDYVEPMLTDGTVAQLSTAIVYLDWLKQMAKTIASKPTHHTICQKCGKKLCACECEYKTRAARRRARRGCKCVTSRLSVEWVTPLGFPVIHKPREVERREIKTTVGHINYCIRIPEEQQTINSLKMLNGIAANFTHSYDAAMLWDVVLSTKEIKDFALIHDSFGALATKTSLLKHSLKRCFVNLYKMRDHLDSFRRYSQERIDQAGRSEEVKLPELPPRGQLNIDAITESEHLFT